MATQIDKICAVLGRYYTSLGKDYDKYFSNYCDANGLDDDTLEEELNVTPRDSLLVDFDEDFPFEKEPKNRPQAILDMITKFRDNHLLSFEISVQKDKADKATKQVNIFLDKKIDLYICSEMGQMAFKYKNGRRWDESISSMVWDPTGVVQLKRFYPKTDSFSTPTAEILLLRSNIFIDATYSKQLLQLIKPLQKQRHNFRNTQFINCLPFGNTPKLQEIIPQFKYFQAYKQLTDNNISITFAPTIYSLKTNTFLTEISGLLCNDINNIKLYKLIAKIFTQFIPLFEECLTLKILNNSKYTQLSLIIKIQDYIFSNKNKVKGKWHCEGIEGDDDIVAVGLYYFDITSTKDLKFDQVSLDIFCKKTNEIENVKINKFNNNQCIVFKNEYNNIEHRANVSTTSKFVWGKDSQPISRKVLTFFLINPNSKKHLKHENLKWINFPSKIKVFVNYFCNYNINIMSRVCDDIIVLIGFYGFGDEEYQRKMITEFKKNTLPKKSDEDKRPRQRYPSQRRTNRVSYNTIGGTSNRHSYRGNNGRSYAYNGTTPYNIERGYRRIGRGCD